MRGTIRTSIDQIIDRIVVTEDNTDRTKVGPDTNKIIGEEILGETWGAMVDKIVEESIDAIMEMTVMTEAGTGLEKGHFTETSNNTRNRSTSNSRSRSGLTVSTNRDRIQC